MSARMISCGAGITAGLELWLWSATGQIVLVDSSPDKRFAADEQLWCDSMNPRLKPAALKKIKNASCKQNPTS